MTTKTVQYNVTRALKKALHDEGGSGNANEETAAMRGVIDFLKYYMSRDGKTKAAAKGGGAKMRGEAAALALQAIAFANKCGGLSITFNSDDEDVSQEEDAAAPNSADVRKHDKAVSERLVGGEQLYGRAKYFEKYRLGVWHKEEKAKLDAEMIKAKDHELRDILEKGLTVKYKELAAQRSMPSGIPPPPINMFGFCCYTTIFFSWFVR